VNRLIPLLGFAGVLAGESKTVRVPDPDAPLTVTGKPATKVARITTGNVPFSAVSTFPYQLRVHLGTAAGYYRGRQPAGSPSLVRAVHPADAQLLAPPSPPVSR
jgi:hypothetical protein